MGAEKGPSLKPSEKGSPYQCGLVSSLLILTLAADLFRPKEHVLQMEQLKWKCKRPSISSQKMSKTTSKNIKHMPANCKFCIFWQKRCYEYCMHCNSDTLGPAPDELALGPAPREASPATPSHCASHHDVIRCVCFISKCPKNWTCRDSKTETNPALAWRHRTLPHWVMVGPANFPVNQPILSWSVGSFCFCTCAILCASSDLFQNLAMRIDRYHYLNWYSQ